MRRKVLLFAAACAGAMAGNVALNGGFEKIKGDKPENWGFSMLEGKAVASADAENAVSGKYSLKIESTGGPEKSKIGHVAAMLVPLKGALSRPVKAKISFKTSAVELEYAYAVLIADSPEKKQVVWKSISKFSGSYAWKNSTAEVDLPAGVNKINFQIRVSAKGTIWVDDVVVDIPEDAIDTTPVVAAKLDVKEETFTFDGALTVTGLPAKWDEKKYFGNENVSDVEIVKEGTRTVAVQKWKTGAARSGFSRKINSAFVTPGTALQLSGEYCCEGDGKTRVGFEFFDVTGNSIGEVTTADISSKEWSSYSCNIIVPEKSSSAAVILLNTGMGTVKFANASVKLGSTDGALKLEAPAITAHVYPVEYSQEQLGVKEKTFETFTNSPTKLTFHFIGDRTRFRKPAVVIDLPAEVKIVDAVCPHPSSWRQEKYTVTELKRPEGAYRRWRFEYPLGMQLAQKTMAYQRRLVMLIMPEKEGDTFTGRRVFYHFENAGESTSEETFLMNMLPPMPKTPNPKKFAFYRWNDEDLTYGNNDAFIASLLCQEEAGYTWASRHYNKEQKRLAETRDILKERGWNLVLRGGMGTSARFLPPEYTHIAVRADGTPKAGIQCPTYFSHDKKFSEFRDNGITRSLSNGLQPGEYLWLDNEEWEPMDWCFCDLCRKYFAELNGLKEVPTTDTIRKQYAPQWRDFRTKLETDLIKCNADIAHKLGFKVADYNYVVDYSSKNVRNHYFSVAKDAMDAEKHIDMHLPSYYHILDSKAFDMMRVGRQYLKKIYMPICAVDGSGSYLSKDEVLSPQRFRMMMLSAAVNGCDGFGIYPGERMPAAFYIAGDKGMAEIAMMEDFFLKGKVVDKVKVEALPYRTNTVKSGGKEIVIEYPAWKDEFRSNVREYDGRLLVSMLNYSTENTAYVRITLPGAIGRKAVCENSGKSRVVLSSGDSSFLVAVLPMDAQFVEIGAVSHGDWKEYPAQQKIKADLEQAGRLANNTEKILDSWQKGAFRFEYTADENGNMLPSISNGQQTLTISNVAAKVADWKVDGVSICPTIGHGQMLAENRVYQPQYARGDDGKKRTFAAVSATCEKGKAVLVVEDNFHAIPLRGKRAYSIPENGRSFTVTSTYENAGKEPLEVVFWVRNWANPGDLENMLLDGDIRFEENGRQISMPRENRDVMIALPLRDKVADDNRHLNIKYNTQVPEVSQRFDGKKFTIRYSPDKEKLTAFFFYNSNSACTVEWHYAPVTILPGKSVSYTECFSVEK